MTTLRVRFCQLKKRKVSNFRDEKRISVLFRPESEIGIGFFVPETRTGDVNVSKFSTGDRLNGEEFSREEIRRIDSRCER